jgi:hypothetical protein
MGPQHLEQYLAAAGGICRQQDAARVRGEEVFERRQGPLRAQVHAPFLWRGRREVVARHSIGRKFVLDLEALVVEARERAEPRLEFFGR